MVKNRDKNFWEKVQQKLLKKYCEYNSDASKLSIYVPTADFKEELLKLGHSWIKYDYYGDVSIPRREYKYFISLNGKSTILTEIRKIASQEFPDKDLSCLNKIHFSKNSPFINNEKEKNKEWMQISKETIATGLRNFNNYFSENCSSLSLFYGKYYQSTLSTEELGNLWNVTEDVEKIFKAWQEIESEIKELSSLTDIFAQDISWFSNSFNANSCQCEHPPMIEGARYNPKTQLRFHLENCLETNQTIEEFKNKFLECRQNVKTKSTSNAQPQGQSPDNAQAGDEQAKNNSKGFTSDNSSTDSHKENQQDDNTPKASERQKIQEEEINQQIKATAAIVDNLEEKQAKGEELSSKQQEKLTKAKNSLKELQQKKSTLQNQTDQKTSSQKPNNNFIAYFLLILLSFVLAIVVLKLRQRKFRKLK